MIFLSKLLNFFFEDKIRYSIFKNAPAFCCEMHFMQCITYFFCTSLQFCRRLYQRGINSPLILICCSPPTGGSHLTSDISEGKITLLLLNLLKAKNKKVPHQRGETILFSLLLINCFNEYIFLLFS